MDLVTQQVEVMIDLDKAGKKATGLKDPNKSLYKYKKNGNINNDRWISRSKFDDFKKQSYA